MPFLQVFSPLASRLTWSIGHTCYLMKQFTGAAQMESALSSLVWPAPPRYGRTFHGRGIWTTFSGTCGALFRTGRLDLSISLKGSLINYLDASPYLANRRSLYTSLVVWSHQSGLSKAWSNGARGSRCELYQHCCTGQASTQLGPYLRSSLALVSEQCRKLASATLRAFLGCPIFRIASTSAY